MNTLIFNAEAEHVVDNIESLQALIDDRTSPVTIYGYDVPKEQGMHVCQDIASGKIYYGAVEYNAAGFAMFSTQTEVGTYYWFYDTNSPLYLGYRSGCDRKLSDLNNWVLICPKLLNKDQNKITVYASEHIVYIQALETQIRNLVAQANLDQVELCMVDLDQPLCDCDEDGDVNDSDVSQETLAAIIRDLQSQFGSAVQYSEAERAWKDLCKIFGEDLAQPVWTAYKELYAKMSITECTE
ncbi:hypothetical protein fHeYen902_163 [Yersinia phage fHe-Yen9-02]|nr:hypothetical protein fHeYen902_163 [Yersinia phage fHe-Yen9-02]